MNHFAPREADAGSTSYAGPVPDRAGVRPFRRKAWLTLRAPDGAGPRTLPHVKPTNVGQQLLT
ncbi:hypothetical protein GCM10010378_00010 [Streptomyces viridochromogenes]